jgi:hypothetical protein
MTYGFVMPLATDLKVENDEFSWAAAQRCRKGAHFGRLTRISPAATNSTASANAGVSGSPNTR